MDSFKTLYSQNIYNGPLNVTWLLLESPQRKILESLIKNLCLKTISVVLIGTSYRTHHLFARKYTVLDHEEHAHIFPTINYVSLQLNNA